MNKWVRIWRVRANEALLRVGSAIAHGPLALALGLCLGGLLLRRAGGEGEDRG